MNTFHLQYFLDAAKSGSISESAKKNNISHSAISQAIKSLEAELKIDLVIHSRRKFQLSSVGEASLPYLENLLGHLSNVKATLQNTHQEPIGDLVIWAPQSLIVDSLMDVIVRYRKKYPRISLKVFTGAAYLVRQNVATQNCHLGITINDHQIAGFENRLLASGNFMLVAKTSKASLENSEILVTHKDKVEVVHLLDQFKQHQNLELPLKTFILSWGLIREFVLKGHGIGYLPEYLVKKELQSKELVRIKHPGKPFKYEVNVIWNSQFQLNRNAELFLKEMKFERSY